MAGSRIAKFGVPAVAIHAAESLKQAVGGREFGEHAFEADIQTYLDDLGRNHKLLLFDVLFFFSLRTVTKSESGVNEQGRSPAKTSKISIALATVLKTTTVF